MLKGEFDFLELGETDLKSLNVFGLKLSCLRDLGENPLFLEGLKALFLDIYAPFLFLDENMTKIYLINIFLYNF